MHRFLKLGHVPCLARLPRIPMNYKKDKRILSSHVSIIPKCVQQLTTKQLYFVRSSHSFLRHDPFRMTPKPPSLLLLCHCLLQAGYDHAQGMALPPLQRSKLELQVNDEFDHEMASAADTVPYLFAQKRPKNNRSEMSQKYGIYSKISFFLCV